MEELAIKIENVSKEYRLGAIGGGTLKGDLQSLWARVRKKEDPNSKIGSDTNIKIGERFLALDGISFEVKKGEAVGIIGHNGAGKSTLLKLLSRVTAPTKGTIGYNGRIASMLEVGTGFHPELTGRENVYMNGAILGMTKAEIDKKFDEIVEFAEMKQFIDTPVKRYSSGMYVKLAFSVAAHLDAEIMIMDEVLAVGDMAFQKKCLDKMRDAAKLEGRTVLYVSHNMNTIRTLCDRCIVLDKGKVIFEGNVEEAIQVYLGSKKKTDAFVELAKLPRDKEFENLPVCMTSIKAVGKDKTIYDVGCSVKVELTFTSKSDFDNVHLRMITKSIQGDPVTMVTSSNSFKVSKDKENKISFTVDTSRLVPNRYTFSPVIYKVDEFGSNVYLDGLKEIFTFEIATIPGFNQNMVWQSKYWGYYYGDSMKVVTE